MIRMIVADDHEVVRAGLRNALTQHGGYEVVAELSTGREVYPAVVQHQPTLLVLDISMPDFDPMATIRQLKQNFPTLKILVVSAHNDESYVVGVLSAGANGYHLKDQPLKDFHLAIERVLAGERWISGPLVERLIHPRPVSQPTPSTAGANLTKRQRELLRLLSQGFDNRKIAQTLDVSIKTVENQLTGLYRALEVNSRLEAVNYALNHPELLALLGSDVPEPAVNHPPADALNVLLVDDNGRYRQQLARMIGKINPQAAIYEAPEIQEALRLAKQVQFHLALVDVVLRDEDGIQCTRRLKALVPSLRVVLISAYPDREFHRLGLAAGAMAFLDKKDLDTATMRQVLDDI